MKSNELMIGDYAIRKNVPNEILIVVAIDSIRGIVYLDLDGLGITEKIENIEPITLTTEILEKSGWRKIGRKTYMDEQMCVLANYSNNKWKMSYGDIIDFTSIPNIRYVHKLQHALRLCGIEKTIKL